MIIMKDERTTQTYTHTACPRGALIRDPSVPDRHGTNALAISAIRVGIIYKQNEKWCDGEFNKFKFIRKEELRRIIFGLTNKK